MSSIGLQEGIIAITGDLFSRDLVANAILYSTTIFEKRSDMGHASVTASMNKNSQWINKWLDMGQPKIVLKVPGPVELDQIKKDAITLAVPWCVIEDAGRTQIAPGTVNV